MAKRHPCSNNHWWSPLGKHQSLLLCVSKHQDNSEVSGNRRSQHGVSPLEQHDSDICNIPHHSRNLVELQDLDLDLGLVLLLREVFLAILA